VCVCVNACVIKHLYFENLFLKPAQSYFQLEILPKLILWVFVCGCLWVCNLCLYLCIETQVHWLNSECAICACIFIQTHECIDWTLRLSLSSFISCSSRGSPRMWGKWGGVGGRDASLSFSRAGFGFQSASNTESEWESYQNNQVFSSIFDGVDYCLNVTCCLFPRQHPCKQLKIIEGVYLLLRKSAFSFQALDVVALIYVCINTVFQFVDVTDMRIVCMCCNVLQCTAM